MFKLIIRIGASIIVCLIVAITVSHIIVGYFPTKATVAIYKTFTGNGVAGFYDKALKISVRASGWCLERETKLGKSRVCIEDWYDSIHIFFLDKDSSVLYVLIPNRFNTIQKLLLTVRPVAIENTELVLNAES